MDVLKDKWPIFIFMIVVLAGIATAMYLHNGDRYALTYYGDAVSHLVAARKLFDWAENPGWSQIGTVWLPLPHLLLLFPSLIDELFFSGFAGLIVGLPCLALTSTLLYKILLRLLTRIPNVSHQMAIAAAVSAALLYGLNPNFLYLGITAMTEAPFMLFLVGAAYFMLRWFEEVNHKEVNGIKNLVLASVCVAAATLCRYEGWVLPLFLFTFASVVVVKRIFRSERMHEIGSASNRNGHAAFAVVLVVLASLVSFSGIAFWLVYNLANYGDPMEFANAQYYSAASQSLSRSNRENLFLQPTNVMIVYGANTLLTFGPIMLVAAAMGFFFHQKIQENHSSRKYTYLLLLLPPIFTITTLLIGVGEMSYWFNSRFVILLAPLLILLIGVYLSKLPARIKRNPSLIVCVIVALFVFYIIVLPLGAVVTLADAKGGFGHKHTPSAVQVGEKIGSIYEGSGSIMIITGSAQEHRILMASGIQFRNFDSIIESSTWKKSFAAPWQYDNQWIILSKDPDSDGVTVVSYWNDNRNVLDQHYDVVFSNEYHEILRLKS
jgi:hypothetical protein